MSLHLHDVSRTGTSATGSGRVGVRGWAGAQRGRLAGSGFFLKPLGRAPHPSKRTLPPPTSQATVWDLLQPQEDPLLQGHTASGTLGTGSPTRASYRARSSLDPVVFPAPGTSTETGCPVWSPTCLEF